MPHLVVIPAYNEQQALPVAIGDLQRLTDEPERYDLLIVNDGSTDRTRQVAEDLARTSRLSLHLLNHAENRGIGAAVQAGYRWAAERDYEYVIQFDGDGQHDARDVPRLVAACRDRGLDLCIGSRYLEPADRNQASRDSGEDLPAAASSLKPRASSLPYRGTFLRRLGTRWLSWLITRRTGVRITDATSGLRCASAELWRRLAIDYPVNDPEPVGLLLWPIRLFRG